MLAGTCASQVIPGKWSQAGVHDDASSTPHRHLGLSGTTGPTMRRLLTNLPKLLTDDSHWRVRRRSRSISHRRDRMRARSVEKWQDRRRTRSAKARRDLTNEEELHEKVDDGSDAGDDQSRLMEMTLLKPTPPAEPPPIVVESTGWVRALAWWRAEQHPGYEAHIVAMRHIICKQFIEVAIYDENLEHAGTVVGLVLKSAHLCCDGAEVEMTNVTASSECLCQFVQKLMDDQGVLNIHLCSWPRGENEYICTRHGSEMIHSDAWRLRYPSDLSESWAQKGLGDRVLEDGIERPNLELHMLATLRRMNRHK